MAERHYNFTEEHVERVAQRNADQFCKTHNITDMHRKAEVLNSMRKAAKDLNK